VEIPHIPEKFQMPENVEGLILEHLRSMRSDIAGIREDVREIKSRLSSLEQGIAGLRRDVTA